MTHGRQSTTPEILLARYAYDEANQFVREDNASIGFTADGHTYYYIKNIQGDVLCVTDETGVPLANYEEKKLLKSLGAETRL